MAKNTKKWSTQNLPYYLGLTIPLFFFLLITSLGILWKNSGYNPSTTGMSELGAIDAPYRHVANLLGFSLLGGTVSFFGFSLLRHIKKTAQAHLAIFLLIIGGVSLFAVGFFPCDSNCIDVTTIGKMHSVLSTISAILIPTAIILLAHPLYKQFNSKIGYLSFYLGMLSFLAGPAMYLPGIKNFTGLVQRFGLGFSLVWMMYLSYILLHFKKRSH